MLPTDGTSCSKLTGKGAHTLLWKSDDSNTIKLVQRDYVYTSPNFKVLSNTGIGDTDVGTLSFTKLKL